MIKKLSNYIDIKYFLRFVFIFLTLNYFNVFYIGVITEGALYSPFIKEYLNYPSWLINVMLRLSNIITHLAGENSYISGAALKVSYGSTVTMEWPCIGLQIMSFWISFVICHDGKLKSKIAWSIGGVIAIIFINSLRIALLSIAMENNWKENSYKDHHTMFTTVAYFIIILMIYSYQKVNRQIYL